MGIGIKDYYYTPVDIAEAWKKEKQYKTKEDERYIIRRFTAILKKFGIDCDLYKSESDSGNGGVFIFGSTESHVVMRKLFQLYDNTHKLDMVLSEEKQELIDNLVELLPACRKEQDAKRLLEGQDRELRKLIGYLDEIEKLEIVKERKYSKLTLLIEKINNLDVVRECRNKKKDNSIFDIPRKLNLSEQEIKVKVYDYYEHHNTIEIFEKRIFVEITANECDKKSGRREFYMYQFIRIKEWYDKWKFIMKYAEDFRLNEKEQKLKRYYLLKYLLEIYDEVVETKEIDVSNENDNKINKEICYNKCYSLVDSILSGKEDSGLRINNLKETSEEDYYYIINEAFSELEEIRKELEKLKLKEKRNHYVGKRINKDKEKAKDLIMNIQNRMDRDIEEIKNHPTIFD